MSLDIRLSHMAGGMVRLDTKVNGVVKAVDGIVARLGSAERSLGEHARRLTGQATLIVIGTALGGAVWSYVKARLNLP